ncbi:N-acetyltransferase [Stakelama sp. CBK3Z-3]|uniref:N-acetyltransferase n=1 Tax=Stakelama flava TaxID=2860338 RepID=A0ABS6XM37_9SPHN|nr:N-acetyltransferase [Stakelama flava]MBW4330495.1 N-acetyltransferase [Stakelama flava]
MLDRAFGTDRHHRTAYHIRAGALPMDALSLAALSDGGELVGSIQCWPVQLRDGARTTPLVMVGPIAVDIDHQNIGIGRAMLREILGRVDAGAAADTGSQMLIGDPGYYAPFGFTADATGNWELPGPVERHRLLSRGAALPFSYGRLEARPLPAPRSGLRSAATLA